MVEKLIIHGFSAVKKAEIEIRKFNVLIGNQASGKSVIAKSCYFFRSISKHFYDGIRQDESKRGLDKIILQDFELRFPRYIWEGTNFQLIYTVGIFEVVLAGVSNKRGKTLLTLSYSDSLVAMYSNKRRLYKKRVEEERSSEKSPRRATNIESRVFYECIAEPISRSEFQLFFTNSLFVPATRSFFANLQKNIFTFMASNLDIDPFLKDFGSVYETAKRFHNRAYLGLQEKEDKKAKESIAKLIASIIDGEYEYNDEQDWIVKDGRKVNLINSSSGQQESLPMLLVLSIWPFIYAEKKSLFFIEEPEAHLFPTAQRDIVSMLSSLVRECGSSFFITTHSPYILSALNNHVFAGGLEKSGKIQAGEFTKLNGAGVPIEFSEVSAYSVSKGFARSICDSEYELIGTEMLDSVSDHFAKVMDSLLEIQGDHE